MGLGHGLVGTRGCILITVATISNGAPRAQSTCPHALGMLVGCQTRVLAGLGCLGQKSDQPAKRNISLAACHSDKIAILTEKTKKEITFCSV